MFRKLLGLATGALLVAAFGVGPFGGPATSEAQAPAMSSVIISFNLPPRAPEIQALSGLSAQVKGEFPMVNAVAADVPTWAVPLIGRIPAVKLVEPDVEVHATTIASELSDSWGVERIGAGPLHAAGKTGAGVRVAILDTGIATGHPDLAYDPSCSFGSSDNGPTIVDGHNHGTHVAGTIAGKRNGTGVVGVAPGVTLCIFKVLANSGSGSSASILAALQWIQNYNTANPSDPIRVTSNSYGANTSLGSSVEAAFNTLNNAGVLNIAAAGNNGNSTCIYPALYASVVSVGSTTSIDAKSSFSSFCADVELAAPGSSVYSTVPATGYATMSGTSMATPHASGSAALLFGAFPNLTNNQVRSLLQSTALDLGTAGRDTSFGFGLVQPAAAIEAAGGTPPPADNPVPVATSLTPASVLAGSAAFTLEVRGSGFISSSVVRLNGSSRTTTFVNTTTLRASISSSDVSTATTKTVTVSNPTPGGGTSSGLTLTISSTPPPPPPPPPPGSALYLSLASSTTVGGVS
ncbi:MAG: S8 family peptidase, partial [Dehalococcoidia bacterium]